MTNRLLTSLLTVLALTSLQAQSLPSTPKLVVGLTIDQLRTDYIEAFASLYGEKGFRRLWKEGKVYMNADYTFASPDRSSAIASLYTGATPSVNGIVGNTYMDISTLRTVPCVDDGNFIGYYTSENSSAARLLASTVTDELKVASLGKALVYSIAPLRDAAIMAAGHAADGAFWMSDITGKWAGSTYYSEYPWWLTRYNDENAANKRIDDIVWTPMLSQSDYKNITQEGFNEGFNYKLGDSKFRKYSNLIQSPFINDEINLLVEEMFKNSELGKDEIPDFLSLTYYAGNYNHAYIQDAPTEIQDTYARLDRSIANLLDLIDKKIGMQHVVLFITSTGYLDDQGTDLGRFRIPTGEFYMDRCTALLNMFLMATYGDGQYIEGFNNLEIFLNHRLIESKQLNLNEIQEKAAEFLVQFSGVNRVYNASRLLLGAWSPDIQKKRNAYHRKISGDLIIDVLPGWTVINPKSADNTTIRYCHTPIPAIFMGNGIKPEIVHTPIELDCIAPTLSRLMRIRAPNASTAMPISGLH